MTDTRKTGIERDAADPAVKQDRQQAELAHHLITQGRFAEAAEILTPLVLAETLLFAPYYDLGCLAVRQGDVETAISLFNMALLRDPGSVATRRNLALAQGIEHRYEEALATLSPTLRSGQAGNEDYGLVRDILGKAPALGPIAWARLLSDLRTPSPEQKRALDEYDALLQQLTVRKSENDHLRAKIAEVTTTQPVTSQATSSFLTALGYLSANSLAGFKWFSDENSYRVWDQQVETIQTEIERYIDTQREFPGYCGLCGQSTVFAVSSGLQLEGHTHLREGMICARCGTHNRGRVLGLAIQDFTNRHSNMADILLMEATTPLFGLLSRRLPNLIGTEFQSPTIAGGTAMDVGGRQVRHENILDLSFPDQSLNLIAHADLLEHVPDVETALSECFRTLRNGGELIFSAPFSQTMKQSRKRAELLPSGEIRHFAPEEYHGTHLAYYNFGWDLLDLCRAAGFSNVRIGVCFDPLQGLLSTGRFGGYFMQPIVFSCIR
ncbi:methyltransferase domain-containing protein [Thauera butanivorans]|uniref:methyltransferase domain-containing protein n=1 Tax=Thauera butanivorans TaxID=86174 RepID=UPI000838C43C|nr:methyltransferase domain-containing protein [Thauera butanivorans]